MQINERECVAAGLDPKEVAGVACGGTGDAKPAASAEPVAQELTRSSMSDPCPHCGAGPYYYCAHPFRAARAAKGADHG